MNFKRKKKKKTMRNLFPRNCLDFILEKIKKDNLFQLFHDFEVGVGDICFIARGKDLTEVSHTWVASPPPPPFQGTLFSICFPPWESNWSVFIYSFFLFFFSYLNGQGMWGRVGAEGGDRASRWYVPSSRLFFRFHFNTFIHPFLSHSLC